MIDTSIVRVHQRAACIARNRSQSMGRSRGESRRPRAPDYWEPDEAAENAELAVASDNAEGADIAA